MSQVMGCSFIIHINELMGLEVPIHKWWQHVINYEVLFILHKL